MSNFSITKDSIGNRLNNNDIIQSNEVRTNCVYFSDGTVQCSGNSLPQGTNYGDYIYWNNSTNLWTVGNTDINLGSFAGQNNQGTNAVALGYTAGRTNQGTNSVAIGNNAGSNNQRSNSVAIGSFAGANTQGQNSVAIGNNCGLNNQGTNSVAIGNNSGESSQGVGSVAIGIRAGGNIQGTSSVAIGIDSGQLNQGNSSVAIGSSSGNNLQGENCVAIGILAGANTQGTNAVAIGNQAGQNTQGTSSVAIGNRAGQFTQGQYAIAIGNLAGQTGQSTNSIVMNANSTWTGDASYQTLQGFFANPIRSVNTGVGTNVLAYNTTSKELYLNTGKTFVIDHPDDKDKYLVHACIEGPENSVFYRGRGKIENNEFTVIELPSYVKRFTHNYNVQVTKIYKKGDTTPIYASDIEDGKFNVYSQVNCEFNWLVIGERSDCRELEVEPNKCDVDVKGYGPYKYL